MWTWGGAIGVTRAGARRAGPAVAKRRIVSANHAITRSATPMGIRLIRAPQSGMTIGDRKSSSPWTSWFTDEEPGSPAEWAREAQSPEPDVRTYDMIPSAQ